MIVDTSALLCVLLDEPGATFLLEAIVDAPSARMSAANWLELAMVVEERGGRLASLRLDEFVRTAGIEVAPVTVEQATAARNAWRYFGRHKHSARLDFGDCFAYALAKTTGEKLLYAGDEFDRTDVEPALPAHRAGGCPHHGPEVSPCLGVAAPSGQMPETSDPHDSEMARPYASPAPGQDGPSILRRNGSREPGHGLSDASGGDVFDASGLDFSCAPEVAMLDAPGCDVSGALEHDLSGAPGRDIFGAPGRDLSSAPGRDAPAPKDH